MENKQIKNLGKIVFAMLFGLGNICFFGYLFTKQIDFAKMGFNLLLIGTAISLATIASLLIYTSFEPKKWKAVKIACGYILLNIPVAVLYTFIGLEILNF